jgi:hypothetical protein
MKKLLLLFLIISSIQSNAQTRQKIDSVYYLLDTAKTSVADRMWDIHDDNGSIYGNIKTYTIQCPCLKNGGKPSFFYSISDRGKGILIDEKQLKDIKLIALNELIAKSKQIENNNYQSDYMIFLIEPRQKKYAIHKLDFINSMNEVHITEKSPRQIVDTSAFKAKGLIQVSSKNLANYINQSVVTSGQIVNVEKGENSKLGILMVGADYPNQDFAIVIKEENWHNFNALEVYLKRWIKVTGKVTTYMGKPIIELTDDSQIQVIGWR